LRIGFFVWEYSPKLVDGLGTHTEYVTHEFVDLGHDVSVFTLNLGDLKTREQNGVYINGEDPVDVAWGIKEVLRHPEKAEIGVRTDLRECWNTLLGGKWLRKLRRSINRSSEGSNCRLTAHLQLPLL